MAAALSRLATVDVLVPAGRLGDPLGDRRDERAPARRPDGAFDLHLVGSTIEATVGPTVGSTSKTSPNSSSVPSSPGWPDVSAAEWPSTEPIDLAVVLSSDDAAHALLNRFQPAVAVIGIASRALAGAPSRAAGSVVPEPVPEPVPAAELGFGVGSDGPPSVNVGLHVPVHPLAAGPRHIGLGFTDYVLVLSGRGPGEADQGTPAPEVAWIASRFPRHHVVVVEDACASVWRARSLRGHISVDSRIDLWRLIAHASMMVDLRPGTLIARECIESLRYGVPIVVPRDGAAARLAAEGGGLWYEDEAELLGGIEALEDPSLREALSEQGRAVADEWYGSGHRFIERLARSLSTLEMPEQGSPVITEDSRSGS